MKNTLLCALPFIASAVMLTVIQVPISWSLLAWVSFVPFILACSPDAKHRRLALVSYVISLCYWLGNLYWLIPVTIAGWIAFCLYTAALWPILALCLRYCRIKKIPLFLASAVLIVGIEQMQGLFLGGFFWRFLAHSQYQNIPLIQIADIFGTAGISFLIAMVNGLLAELIIAAVSCHPFDKLRAGSERSEGSPLPVKIMRFFVSLRMTIFLKIAVVCAAVVATIIYGRWRISQEDQCIQPGPYVASLQSNVPQSVKRTFKSSEDLFNGLMEHSKASAQAGAELIVWPETMVQATLNPEVLRLLEPSHTWKVFDERLREHSKDTAFVLVGAYGGMPEIRENLEIYLAKRYNSAFLYNIDGTKAPQSYNKIHLVPFGEFLPFRKNCLWLYNFLMKFTPYNYDYSLDAGSKYTVFEMTGQGPEAQAYKFGVMICYEDTVPEIARRFAIDKQGTKRLDWLVNISNDGWFVRFKDEKVLPSAELAQHAAVCAFRAVENRLAILRSVNTGISCLIDSSGSIRYGFVAGNLPPQTMARTGMPGWFLDRIMIDKRTTFFSKFGEWLGFCCEVCLILLIIVSLSARFFRTKKFKTLSAGKLNGT
ncbi:MAG TPA: apolipoprotein N-acyltransferase [Sedimentisphaerales bacterium]|nr:apolipoprotein N-acyltransferase [Sedimentisphaerales bacterium]